MVAAIGIVSFLLGACADPFRDNSGKSPGGYGTVTVSLSNAVSASSTYAVIPSVESQLATYSVTFTSTQSTLNPDGPVVNGITDPTQPISIQVPVGTWYVFASGFRPNGDPAARSDLEENPVVVEITNGTNVTLDSPLVLRPRKAPGTDGSARVELSFQSGDVSAVTNVQLLPLNSQPDPQSVPAFTIDGTNGTAVWQMSNLPVGRYQFLATVEGPGDGGADVVRANINLVLDIYTNLESSVVNTATGTPGLALDDTTLSSPPAPPTDLFVKVASWYVAEDPPPDPPNAQIDLEWSDNAITETGYRIYVDGVETEPLDNFDPWRAFSVPVPAAQNVTVDVVAYNRFGESIAASWTGVVPGQPEVISPLNGEYVAPGTVTLEWDAATGAESYIVGVGGSQYEPDQEFTVPSSQTTFEFIDGSAGTNYSWYVFAVHSAIDGRVVNSNSADGFFRIRDGVYVDAAADAGGDGGSPGTAFQTIGEGVAEAVQGETVFVADGNYDELVSITTPDIVLAGQGDNTVLYSSNTGSATLSVSGSATGVTIRDMQIQPTGASTRAAISVGAANVTIVNNLIADGLIPANGTTLRGISGGAAGLVVSNNRFLLAQGAESINTRFALNLTGSGSDAANPIIIEKNSIEFGDGPGSSNVGVQPQGDFFRVANNVVVQAGTAAGPAFSGLRVAVNEEGIVFLHNTVVNANTNRAYTGLAFDGGTGTVATNNIFLGNGDSQTGINSTGGTASEVNANLFWGLTSVAGASWGDTIYGLNTQPFATGNVEGDPMLSPGSGIGETDWYAPTADSLIDDGDSAYLATVPEDILGVSRTRPTIGAYEVSMPQVLAAHWAFTETQESLDSSVYGNVLSQTGDQAPPSFSEDPIGSGNFYTVLNNNSFTQNTDGYTVDSSISTRSGTDGQTVSFWFREGGAGTGFGQQGTIVRRDRDLYDPSQNVFWIGSASATTMRIAVNNSAQTAADLSFGPDLADSVWNHIVVVFDYGAGKLRVYVDDIELRDVFLSGVSYSNMNAPGPIYLGRFPDSGISADSAVFGHLDDVRIYNYPMTGTDVQGIPDR